MEQMSKILFTDQEIIKARTSLQLGFTHFVNVQHKHHMMSAAEKTFVPTTHMSESKQNERQRI